MLWSHRWDREEKTRYRSLWSEQIVSIIVDEKQWSSRWTVGSWLKGDLRIAAELRVRENRDGETLTFLLSGLPLPVALKIV
mgnify:CR=1 FL=1